MEQDVQETKQSTNLYWTEHMWKITIKSSTFAVLSYKFSVTIPDLPLPLPSSNGSLYILTSVREHRLSRIDEFQSGIRCWRGSRAALSTFACWCLQESGFGDSERRTCFYTNLLCASAHRPESQSRMHWKVPSLQLFSERATMIHEEERKREGAERKGLPRRPHTQIPKTVAL